MSKRCVVWFCLVLLLASVCAYGQISLDVKNSGSEVMTRSRGLVTVNCSTNVTCTQVSGQWTITATGTSYADNLPHWTGAGPALFDNGIITGTGSAQDGTAVINKLVEASGANLVLAGTANAGNPVFIVRNIRDAAHVDVCTAGEQCSCVFDGATTAGHHVGKSTTAGGSCKDLGVAGSADPPAGVRSIGTVLTTNGAGGTYVVQLGQGYKQVSSLPLANLATQAADTVVMNASGSVASPTAVLLPTSGTNGCSGTTDMLQYNNSSHALGCGTSGGGAVFTNSSVNITGNSGDQTVYTISLSPPGAGKCRTVKIPFSYTAASSTAKTWRWTFGTEAVKSSAGDVGTATNQAGELKVTICNQSGVQNAQDVYMFPFMHYSTLYGMASSSGYWTAAQDWSTAKNLVLQYNADNANTVHATGYSVE